MLTDGFERIINNVRFSITDRCNMRCVYCMPKEPVWMPHEEILTYEELLRLARVFVSLGVWKIRVTGGEPTVRRGVVEFVGRLLRTPGLRDASLTTNGFLLGTLAAPLREAGLSRLNVSLDTLDRKRFAEITRTDTFDRVLEGLAAARRAGFDPIKVNFVAVRGVNDDEVAAFAAFGRDEGFQVRFIEFMPLDAENLWERKKVYSKREILADIGARFPWEAATGRDPHSPAEEFRYKDGRGTFGVIGSVTEPFCGRCDRVRVTADGKFRTCLFSIRETDLKGPLRRGAGDEELAEIIRVTVLGKEPGHFINTEGFQKPPRTMHRIGG
jgi:cyclic pyranopterin phosphate synthase